MASSFGKPGAGSGSYTAVAAHELRRQRSMPAAFAVAPCYSYARGGQSPRSLWNDDDRHGYGRFSGQCAPTSRPSGGVGTAVRALWAWLARGRRKVLSRSGSLAKEQYGHEEYAQNFDEGAAAGEPENLSRSFSARYAARRLAGQGP